MVGVVFLGLIAGFFLTLLGGIMGLMYYVSKNL